MSFNYYRDNFPKVEVIHASVCFIIIITSMIHYCQFKSKETDYFLVIGPPFHLQILLSAMDCTRVLVTWDPPDDIEG